MTEQAVIDIGTNSALLLVGRKEGDRILPSWQKIATPRVGRGVSASGRIALESFAALKTALTEFLEILRERNVPLVGAVATEAFRQAENGPELLLQISALLQTPCRILSGEEESELSYLAVRSCYADAKLWVLDIGGGSTEIHNGFRMESFPIGAVGFTERFGPDDEAMTREAQNTFSQIHSQLGETHNASLIVVGGTASALALLTQGLAKFDPKTVEGFAAAITDVSRWRKQISKLSVTERNSLPGLDGNRGEIILAGLAIWEGFLHATGISAFRISDRGLRYGLLWKNWKGESPCV